MFSENCIHDMVNFAKKQWQIHDDNGVLLSGDQSEMLYAWNINCMADWAFKKIYGHTEREDKWRIKEYSGDLRLICVVEHAKFSSGTHKWEEHLFS